MDNHFAVLHINELLGKILNYINDGTTYKIVRLVCFRWYTAVGNRVDEFSNHLWTLIKKCPEEYWDWYSIIINPNTSIEKIINIEDKTFTEFTRNKMLVQKGRKPLFGQVDMEKIFELLSINPRLTWDIISKFQNENWDWHTLSAHKNITWDIIVNQPKTNWKDTLVLNPNLTWEHMKHENILKKDLYLRCGNINITENFILENLQLINRINWRELVFNKNITWPFIQKYCPNYQNYMTEISANINITPQIVKENSNLNWNYRSLSINPGIPIFYILAHPDKSWDWEKVSARKDTTIDIVEKNPHISWKLSRNPNMTWRWILSHPKLEWNWSILSMNKFSCPYSDDITTKLGYDFH